MKNFKFYFNNRTIEELLEIMQLLIEKEGIKVKRRNGKVVKIIVPRDKLHVFAKVFRWFYNEHQAYQSMHLDKLAKIMADIIPDTDSIYWSEALYRYRHYEVPCCYQAIRRRYAGDNDL